MILQASKIDVRGLLGGFGGGCRGGGVAVIVVLGKGCVQVFLVLICYSLNPTFKIGFITDFIL